MAGGAPLPPDGWRNHRPLPGQENKRGRRRTTTRFHTRSQCAYRAPSTLDEDLERFFFTHRELKYPNGKRPNRRAGSGFWKATGSFPDVLYRGKKVGNKRSLVFYEGPDSKKGKKTDWLMQEFVLDDGQYSDSSWVCCKIYYHGRERPAASSMDIPTNAIVQFNSPSSVVNHDEYESVVLPEMLSAEQTRRLGEIYANLSDNFPDATVSTTTTCEYVDAFLLPGAGAAGGDSAADLCCEFFFTDLDCSVRFDSDLATTTTTTEQLAATTESTAECSLYPVAAETHDWDIPAMDTFGFDQDFL
ncbi:hypothetical protein H6P81_007888 [Aristolochia fimbriata]|uniref:NAC domain-containing protein n=1 Tax=Aristolochia fimbriata TaxID=158543 RepID=A0AAV7F2P3_ARIFI|nr:hypothetical protein H6P81_007888 [Aristolochia fimbriata]